MFRKKHTSDRLCDFLAYAWHFDGSSYVEIVRLLYPHANRKFLPEHILPDYPSERDMTKLVS